MKIAQIYSKSATVTKVVVSLTSMFSVRLPVPSPDTKQGCEVEHLLNDYCTS